MVGVLMTSQLKRSRFFIFRLICCLLSFSGPVLAGDGLEQNVWLDAQNKNSEQVARKYTLFQEPLTGQSGQPSRYELPSYPDSLSSPYFYYEYAPDYRSARVPLMLSDQELAIFFVDEPSINVKATLEAEDLFFFVPDDFKCRNLIPTGAVFRASNNPDSLYAPYDSCLATLPRPLLRSEQITFTISSDLSDEDLQYFLHIEGVQPWRIYRRFKSSDDEVLMQIERLRQNSDIDKVWEMFYTPDPTAKMYPLMPSDRVVVLFRNNVSQAQVNALNMQYGTEALKNTNNIFHFKINAGGGIAALEVTELFRQDPQILVAESSLYWWTPGGAELPPTIYEIFISEGRFRIDFNKSGASDFEDFILFAGGFGSKAGEPTFDSRFDLNDDGQIAFTDFILFVKVYEELA